MRATTTTGKLRHHQNSQLGASSAQNRLASVSSGKLSSLTAGWPAKIPTKGSAPLQLVPLLGTLANCCSTHVFGGYPRRTPAKSTDTAF
ncbi:hypothetical protein PIB30_097880 [Stylosanthes scabra]|uniref:Uncharacterized protein n=1 Tax=Stylosanthes scabra TaxID=79078 RepID=A0ABU6RWD6_9FABA|nr:hypothetical protein [Stylosanthes scabra]